MKPEPNKENRSSQGLLIANAIVRFLVFAFLFVGTVFFGTGEAIQMFEEYEISLPAITQMFFEITEPARRFSIFIIPLLLGLWIGLEFLVISIPREKGRRTFNILIWLLLLFALAVIAVALLIPYMAIYSGLHS
ncbi:MAG: hypothetical protein AAF456_17795 [Planctomycetota bacterium]